MKAQDKPGYVAESRKIFEDIDIEKLISNPNDLTVISKINRLIAIFTNFSSNDGQELRRLLIEFQDWARRSRSAGTIRNRATDVMQFIGQKIEEMDIYVIDDKEVNRKKQERVVKELKDENLFVRSVFEGKDMHLFIAEKGKQEHIHLIFDAVTGEIRIDPDDQAPTELIEKVVSVTTKSGKVIEATLRGTETSLGFQEPRLTTEPPVLYITSSVGASGGPNGHFDYFTIKNISNTVAVDITWGIRGFSYEWRSQDSPFELDPGKEKKVEFKISDSIVFSEIVPELNIFLEYKDAMNNAYFVRRELLQERVPSGAFFQLKTASFHPPTLLVNDGLTMVTELPLTGDKKEAEFSIQTPQGKQRVKIGISRTFLSTWGFNDDKSTKQALLELGHRKIRKMVKENKLGDYLFVTTDFPQDFQSGYEGYTKLRDSL